MRSNPPVELCLSFLVRQVFREGIVAPSKREPEWAAAYRVVSGAQAALQAVLKLKLGFQPVRGSSIAKMARGFVKLVHWCTPNVRA